MPVGGEGRGRCPWDGKHLGTRMCCGDGCSWPSPFHKQHLPCTQEARDSLPPRCESVTRSRTNSHKHPDPYTTSSHTSPLAQLEKYMGTSSDRVKTREGHGRRHRGHSGEGFSCGHLWCSPAAQGEWVGSWEGLSSYILCKAELLRLAIPARGPLWLWMGLLHRLGKRSQQPVPWCAFLSDFTSPVARPSSLCRAPKTKASPTTGAAPEFSQACCSCHSPKVGAQPLETNCHGMLVVFPSLPSHHTSKGKAPFVSLCCISSSMSLRGIHISLLFVCLFIF